MKLVRIEHSRCQEWAATTFVWAPDDWTQDQLEGAVARAKIAYQTFIDGWKEIKDDEPPNPGYRPDYEAHPLATVAQVKAAFEEAKAVWSKWEKARQDTFKGFAEYLKAEGLTLFYDVPADMSVVVDWYHQHGKKIDYSETEIDGNDLRESPRVEF